MTKRQINGVDLEVHDTGGADLPVICFSHGLLFRHQLFAPQIEALRATHRCIAWDHRGQGLSEVPPGRVVTIEAVTTDAIRLIEDLDVGPVHFVGLSMGGFVGMRIAARRPDLVRSLVLLATAADPEPVAHLRRYGALTAFARIFGVNRLLAARVLPIFCGASTLSGSAHAATTAHIRALLMRNGRSVYKAVNGVLEREGVDHELSRIQCPTLVIRAREDAAISAPRAQALADGIPGATFVELPEGGHSVTLERPDAVLEVLQPFLSAGT